MVSKKLEFLRRKSVLSLFLVAALALVLGTAAPQLGANQRVVQYDDVEFFIEVNATDGDAGVQLFLDGNQWKNLMMFNPDGVKLLDVNTNQNLMVQGITEYFFESAEPSFDDVPLDVFLARFPEGEYTFVGETVDGERIEGSAEFTHLIPDAPVIIYPQDGDVVEADDLEIEWEPVTSPAGVEIVSYEVIVESDDADSEFRVLLPADATEVEVPEAIFDPEVSEYKFEILAKEESGNQTITETEFEVVFDEDDDEDEDEHEDGEDEDELEAYGKVASLSDDEIGLDDGSTFEITDETEIDDEVSVGAEVEVIYEEDDGDLVALEVEVEDEGNEEDDDDEDEDSDEDEDEDSDEDEDEDQDDDDRVRSSAFSGTIVSINNNSVRLNRGLGFIVNDNTEFNGDVKVGAEVDIEFAISMGRFIALVITVDDESDEDDEADEDIDEADEDEADEELDEDGEQEITGVVKSLTDTLLVLESGVEIQINSNTEFAEIIGVGDSIEADVISSGDKLIAIEVDLD